MNSELISYYINLLIIRYRNKPNASGTIEALIKSLMIYDLIRSVENGYDEETAVGVQLDVLAKYVGAQRISTGVDFERVFFGSVDYDEIPPYLNVTGFISYDDLNPPDSQFLKYNTDEGSLFELTDAELRILIKLKIAQNNSDHSTGEIDEFLNEFFPGQVVFDDNFDMTISYIFSQSVTRIVSIAVSQNAIPKAAGVGLLISFV